MKGWNLTAIYLCVIIIAIVVGGSKTMWNLNYNR